MPGSGVRYAISRLGLAACLLAVVAFSALSAEPDWRARVMAVDALFRKGQWKQGAEETDKLDKDPAAPVQTRIDVLLVTAQHISWYTDGSPYCRRAEKLVPDLKDPAFKATTLLRIAELYDARLRRPDDVARVVKEAGPLCEGKGDKALETRYRTLLADVRERRGEFAAAAETYLQLAENTLEKSKRCAYYEGAVRCLAGGGDVTEAVNVFRTAQAEFPDVLKSEPLLKIADAFAKQGKHKEAIGYCREAVRMSVQTSPLAAPNLEGQARVVDFLLLAGNDKEAVADARRYFLACPIQQIDSAVSLVAKTLKAADGGVADRLKTFLLYQSYGPAGKDGKPGTEDDLADPFAKLKLDAPSEYALAPPQPPGPDAVDRYRMGYLRLLAGDAPGALAQFRCAYAAADGPKLSEIVYGVATGLKAVDGHVHRANQYIVFQQFGPAGRDGKPGTDDDLKDPFSGIQIVLPPDLLKAYDAEIAKCGATNEGCLRKGGLLLASGRAQDGLKAMQEAYRLCPFIAADLQKTIMGVAAGIRAVDGHVFRANAYILYQKHGKAGPDGKPGTEDDLSNPLGKE